MRSLRVASLTLALAALALLAGGSIAAAEDEIGRIKVAKGAVHVERGGNSLPATVGFTLHEKDQIVTGADGSVGITFADDSQLSAGPNSVLAIDRFAFDSTTHAGSFETVLRQGTLAAVSGKIARQSPDAMRVRTSSMILGVRGTEFLVWTSAPVR